jgi:hypothetical protein
LRPDPDKLTGEILFDNLFPWEIEQLGDTTIVNREYNDIGFKYKVPAACGPEE